MKQLRDYPQRSSGGLNDLKFGGNMHDENVTDLQGQLECNQLPRKDERKCQNNKLGDSASSV
jgi:hypothetical protein